MVKNPAGDGVGSIDYSGVDLLPTGLVRLKAGAAMRARRRMFQTFRRVIPSDRETRVLDVGVTPDRAVEANNFLEAMYPWKDRITATSVEDASWLEEAYPGLRFVRTDGTTLPFEDKGFDIVFSSAVLEHVGSRESQAAFVAELLRVGRSFFLTTPDRWFPVDLHTAIPLLHWTPQRTHQWLLRQLGMDFWASTENLNLLTPRTLRALFPARTDVQLLRYRTLGLTSNLIAFG